MTLEDKKNTIKFNRKRGIKKRETSGLVNWNTVDNERLIKAFMPIDTPDLMRLFLDDLMTKDEIERCADRLWTAEMIFTGMPYKAIQRYIGFSPVTIAKASKKMIGQRGGYCEIMRKLHPHGIRYQE
jgi:uncharacterized protein YerC